MLASLKEGKILVVGVALIVLIGGLSFFYLKTNKKSVDQRLNYYKKDMGLENQTVSRPRLYFGSKSFKTYGGKKEVSVDIVGDVGADITAMDIIVVFDPQKARFEKAKSLADEYLLYAFSKNGKIILTLVKKPEFKGRVFLRKKRLVNLRFELVGENPVEFKIVPQEGNRRSQFIDSKNNRIQVEGDTLTL